MNIIHDSAGHEDMQVDDSQPKSDIQQTHTLMSDPQQTHTDQQLDGDPDDF